MKPQKYERVMLGAILIALVCAQTMNVCAQRIPCRIVFKDKGGTTFTPGSDLYEATLATFAQAALDRRARIGMNPLLDSVDKPIHPPYLEAVAGISDSVLVTNAWLNVAVVGLTAAEQMQVRTLPFVHSVRPCSTVSYTVWDGIFCDPPRYGDAFPQILATGALPLHNAGVYGRNVRVAMIDNGFRWKSMTSLKHLNVAAEYDVIYGDTITANQPGDPPRQDEHGSGILSIIAGWKHDSLIGVAPFATYLLAKSEDMRYEKRIEEDIYVEAVTWAERNGADIMNTSLGYRYFDSTDAETPYIMFNGKTAFATRAVNLAAERGVVCVIASGNNGPEPLSLNIPADADSAVSVGALFLNSSWWPLTSIGPTTDNRIKPDLAAVGVGTISQNVLGNYIRSGGTSNAAPIVAGQFALLRELYPTLPPWEIRRALYASARIPSGGEGIVAYGVANVESAARDLGPGVGPPAVVYIDGKRTILVAVFTRGAVERTCTLRNSAGTTIEVTGETVDSMWVRFVVPDAVFDGPVVDARITVTSDALQRTAVYPRDGSWFAVPFGDVVVPCGMRFPSTVTGVSNNEPPFEAQVSPTILVADHPLSAQSEQFTLIGCTEVPFDVRCVHVATGVTISATATSTDANALHVRVASPLQTGAYLVVLRFRTHTAFVPTIVY